MLHWHNINQFCGWFTLSEAEDTWLSIVQHMIFLAFCWSRVQNLAILFYLAAPPGGGGTPI